MEIKELMKQVNQWWAYRDPTDNQKLDLMVNLLFKKWMKMDNLLMKMEFNLSKKQIKMEIRYLMKMACLWHKK